MAQRLHAYQCLVIEYFNESCPLQIWIGRHYICHHADALAKCEQPSGQHNFHHKRQFLNEMSNFTSTINSGSDSEAANAYIMRGSLYNKVADYDRAIIDLNEAIRRRNDLREGYHQRGKAYEGIGNKDKVIADFSKFLELSQVESDRTDAKEHLSRLGVTK